MSYHSDVIWSFWSRLEERWLTPTWLILQADMCWCTFKYRSKRKQLMEKLLYNMWGCRVCGDKRLQILAFYIHFAGIYLQDTMWLIGRSNWPAAQRKFNQSLWGKGHWRMVCVSEACSLIWEQMNQMEPWLVGWHCSQDGPDPTQSERASPWGDYAKRKWEELNSTKVLTG